MWCFDLYIQGLVHLMHIKPYSPSFKPYSPSFKPIPRLSGLKATLGSRQA